MRATRSRREEEMRPAGPFPEVDPSEIVASAQAIVAAYHDVEAVYLFGSRASEESRPGSDVDLAVLLRAPARTDQRLGTQAELSRMVEDRMGVPVDVVVVDRRLPPGLLFDIFSVETILAARDWERAHRVACQARAEYRDLLPRLDRAFERVLRRIEDRADALNRS